MWIFILSCFEVNSKINPFMGTQGCHTSLSGLPDFSIESDNQSVSAIFGAASMLGKKIDLSGAQMSLPMYYDEKNPIEGVKVGLANIGVAGEYLYEQELSQRAVQIGLPIVLQVEYLDKKELVMIVGSLSSDCKKTDAFVGYNFTQQRWGSLPVGIEGVSLIVGDSKDALVNRIETSGLQIEDEKWIIENPESSDVVEYETALNLVENLKSIESPGDGVLFINSRPWGFIFVDSNRYSPWFRGEIPKGNYEIQIVSNDGRYHELSLVVRQDSTTRYCWDFDLNDVCQR
jgi:hypothetical protein